MEPQPEASQWAQPQALGSAGWVKPRWVQKVQPQTVWYPLWSALSAWETSYSPHHLRPHERSRGSRHRPKRTATAREGESS